MHVHHTSITDNVGARETLRFVQSHIKPGATILDVGAGTGVLAKLLAENGFRVTAIDYNKDAIEEAKAVGVAIEYADFLQYKSSEPFDAVLFSRSLHHIHPVAKAVKHACTLIDQPGKVVVEDFGAELLDLNSALWFYGLKAFLQANGVAPKGRGPKIENGEIPSDPVGHWRDHHFGKHDVAESTAVLEALRLELREVDYYTLPYLYRYFLDDVSEDQARKIEDWEKRLCDAGTIVRIGFRFVGEKTS